jgi:hypothetical protein
MSIENCDRTLRFLDHDAPASDYPASVRGASSMPEEA